MSEFSIWFKGKEIIVPVLKIRFWGNKKMGKWKYFTDEESVGLTDDICLKRDRAREYFGAPVVQTAGFRTPEHNAEIGGVPDSAHTKGMAIDVRAPKDPAMREKMMWAFGLAGFKRAESAPNHFHYDTDYSKPTPCFFQGDDH